ncbi:MAG: hypothetical protein JKY33_07265 [Bacteroidia bacterium]|nr:hypothetical protein [Bacteroidia bacterium]
MKMFFMWGMRENPNCSQYIKLLILLILTIIVHIVDSDANAQSKSDSLKTEIKKDLPDTTRIKILNSLALEWLYANPDSTIWSTEHSILWLHNEIFSRNNCILTQ